MENVPALIIDTFEALLGLTRDVDTVGRRTLDIITKPDWLRRGSDMERAFANLANNENIEFHLGWHILTNRDDDHRIVLEKSVIN